MIDSQITRMIDALSLTECLAVLAICAPDLPQSVIDDLANDPNPASAAVRARQLVHDIRRMQLSEFEAK